VALVADNGPWWLPADLAVLATGAVVVPRGSDTTPAELGLILAHSGATAALAVGEEATRRLLAAPGREALRFAARLDARRGETPAGLLAGDDLVEGPPADPDRLPAVGPEDPASVIYTSGTTGRAKGVTLLHRNFLHQLRTIPGPFDFRPGDRFLVMLPPWHCFERVVEYVAASVGGEIAHSHPRLLKEHIPAVRPTWMASVPRVWEMVLALSGWPRLAPRDPERAAAALRAAVGGELRCAVAGGGRCPDAVDRAFNGSGIRFLVGYGLTETAPVLTVRLPEQNRVGTLGRPLPETGIRVVAREGGGVVPPGTVGVIQARGPQVMRGYWKEPELTARVLAPDGWFDTGDLGEQTPEGDLLFRGRAKDTIALRGGEKVEPQPLEDRLTESPFIEYAVVVGQDRKVLGALLVPRMEAVRSELAKNKEVATGVPVGDAAVQGLLKGECARLLTEEAGFAAHERVSRVAVLGETFTPENGLVTGTLKVKRHAVLERYAGVVEELFGGD
jgi:long-chain acyl-CoA synthetase